jgi:hypothetical protein
MNNSANADKLKFLHWHFLFKEEFKCFMQKSKLSKCKKSVNGSSY